MENKGILEVEFSEVDLESVYVRNNRESKGRSSILKQARIIGVDICDEDYDTTYGRKSQNVKRVSFANTFQVKELNTGNIYDIPGSNTMESSKESSLSIQYSAILDDKENVNMNSLRLALAGSLKDVNSDSCINQVTYQGEVYEETENMSLSESVILSPDLDHLPLNSTAYSSHNKKSNIGVLSDMDVTLTHGDRDVSVIKAKDDICDESCQYQTCQVVRSVSCITHSVCHSTLKSANPDKSCILATKSAASQIEMPRNYDQLCCDDQEKENLESKLIALSAAKHGRKNSFRVISNDADHPYVSSSQNASQYSRNPVDILTSKSTINTPKMKVAEYPMEEEDIFHPSFMKSSAPSLRNSDFDSKLLYSVNNMKPHFGKSSMFLDDSFESQKENYSFLHLQMNSSKLNEPNTTGSSKIDKRDVCPQVAQNSFMNKTNLDISEMDLTEIIPKTGKSDNMHIKAFEKKAEYFKSHGLESTYHSMLSQDQNQSSLAENLVKQSRVEKLRPHEQSCTSEQESAMKSILQKGPNVEVSVTDQSTLTSEAGTSSVSESFDHYSENNLDPVIKGQLKRFPPTTPGIVYSIGKFKKLKLNQETTQETAGNLFSQGQPASTEQSIFKFPMQLKAGCFESSSVNSHTSITPLPTFITDCTTSSESNPSNQNVSVSSAVFDLPSRIPQNVSQNEEVIVPSRLPIEAEKSANPEVNPEYNIYEKEHSKVPTESPLKNEKTNNSSLPIPPVETPSLSPTESIPEANIDQNDRQLAAIHTLETCSMVALQPSSTPTKKEPGLDSHFNLDQNIEHKESVLEEHTLSLDSFKESLKQSSSGKECRWQLKTLDEHGALFKLKWGPWIYKCSLSLHIKQESSNESSVTFERDDDDDDRLTELGYKVFQHLAKEKSIPSPVCSSKTILKLSEYSSIAYKVETLMIDLLHMDLSYPSYTTSNDLDSFKIEMDIINEKRRSSCRLTCRINLHTYPNEIIVPELEHRYLNDITDEIKIAASLVEPGKNYIWNIAKAAHNV